MNISKILELHKKWLTQTLGGERADFKKANLSFRNLRNADLRGADLIDVNLSSASLVGADFSETDLTGAYFRYANLKDANLSEANLYCVNLKNANLAGANLNGAILNVVDLSGATGLLSQVDYLNENFERTDEGFIAYKVFGGHYDPPKKWVIEPGSVIEENVNFNRCNNCGCGVNVSSLLQVINRYGGTGKPIWKVLIRNEWLAGVCVPYHTKGDIRCERVELIEIIKEI